MAPARGAEAVAVYSGFCLHVDRLLEMCIRDSPKDIRYLLEKAWHLATTGRPGPVWLDIPVNFQGGYIETAELRGYGPAEDDAQLPDVYKRQLQEIMNLHFGFSKTIVM